MEVVVTKNFIKQVKKCPPYIQQSAKAVLESLQSAKDIREIPDVKKLEGYKIYYRIRIGDYRIGMKLIKPQIIMITILHRSRIYKNSLLTVKTYPAL